MAVDRVFILVGMVMGMGMLALTTCMAAEIADDILVAFHQAYLEEEFRLHPVMATQLGDHRFDHLLDDVSIPARRRWQEHARVTLEELPRRVPYAQLSREAQIDYEIFRDDLRRSLWLFDNEHPFEEDPRIYGDYVTDGVYRLFMQSTVAKETCVRNAIARMRLAPVLLAIARQTLTNPPRVVVETASRQNRGAIVFFERELFDLVGTIDQREAFAAAAGEVVAALRIHQRFLDEELLPRATGAWRIGKERFSRKLELVLDAGVGADQVLADARTEFARIRGEMAFTAKQLWSRYFPQRALPPADAAGVHEMIALVLKEIGRDHGAADDLVHDAQATIAGLKDFITSHHLLNLPDPDPLAIIDMPEFRRGNSVADLSSAPPLDPDAASIYAISPPPKDWDRERAEGYLQEYNRRMLQLLSIHEAYPGHNVQLYRANKVPSLIRRILGSGVYSEGWAVYCEQMMLDQGYGAGDLALRLVHLKYNLRSSANAILDHGMHCSDMSDEEALHLLVDEAFQATGEAALKVVRAKQGSCQLSTYFVGHRAMQNLRRDVQRRMGDRFDLFRYHEAVLAPGSVPVKYLPDLVNGHLTER